MNGTWSYGYDEFNRLKTASASSGPFSGLTMSWGSDGLGERPVCPQVSSGVTTTYTYDNLNRLLSRSTPGETTVSFTYTATGKRQTMTDASGTTTYSYDDMDRLSSKATPQGTLSYTYDTAGHVASVTSNHANGVSVSYTYDDLNRLETVVDARLSGSQTTTYGYDPASNVGTVA